ncbi:MAG: CBS domain-containing protein [Deltaproteobacteria bacterium]|nr:CBS domain-containing protein [Nannocystaceae bacterium]
MNRRIPSVLTVMTPFPYAVDEGDSVEDARAMMREHDIHHLPVLKDGKLDGVVSSRDIDVTLGVLDQQTVAVQLTVGAICTREPYVVEVDARLDEVAEEIGRRRIGSALITKHGKLAGILTIRDVCNAFVAELRGHPSDNDDDDDVA